MISKIRLLLENESIKQEIEKLIQRYGVVHASNAVGGFKKLHNLTKGESSGDDFEDFNNFITDKVFSLNDSNELEMRFKVLSSNKVTIDDSIGFMMDCVVLEGRYFADNDRYELHFASGDIPLDDFSSYFEFKEYVEYEISSFLFKICNEFNIKVDFINIQW
jgi:hypothetical protein